MEWIGEYGPIILQLVTIAAMVAWWLWKRNYDLEKLVGEGLLFLQGWAGDELQNVTKAEVHQIADIFYAKYLKGSSLSLIVSEGTFRSLLWGGFCRWREQFIGVYVELAK